MVLLQTSPHQIDKLFKIKVTNKRKIETEKKIMATLKYLLLL